MLIPFQKFYKNLFHDSAIFWTEANGGEWISLSSSVFMEKDFEESSNLDEACEAARHFLSKVGIKTVNIPKFFLAAIKKFNGSLNITKTNAVKLRTALKNNPAVLENQALETKFLLLEFAISDENFDQMAGIKLIPLADGTFSQFDAGSIHPIFVDSVEHPRILLPLLNGWFLDKNIPQKIWSGLTKAAKKNCKYFNYTSVLLLSH
jgi:sacsin